MTSPATEWSPGQPLPMSCSRAATSSRSGRPTRRVRAEARTAVSTRCRSTVQRVHGVALRPAAHPLPVGQQPGDQALGLQRLPDLDGGLARAEQRDELLAGLGGPGHGQRPGGGGQPPHGVQGRAAARPGRRRPRRAAAARGRVRAWRPGRAPPRRPARRRLRRAGCARRPRAVGRRRAWRAAAAVTARDRSTRPTSRQVTSAGVRDGARGLVDLAQQRVGVEQAELGGDLVLFLEREPVGGAAGGQVQGVAGVEQPAAGVLQPLAGGVGEPGGGDGAQRGGVAQAAAGLLQVGFEQVGSSPWRSARSAHSSWSSGSRLGAWCASRRGRRCAGRRSRPRSPARCRASSRPSWTLRSSAAVLRASRGGAHGVVQGQAEVPDRVPDAVGQGGDGSGVGRRRAAAAGRGRCGGRARRGRSRRRRPGPSADPATPRRPPVPWRPRCPGVLGCRRPLVPGACARSASHSSVSSARAARRGGPDRAPSWVGGAAGPPRNRWVPSPLRRCRSRHPATPSGRVIVRPGRVRRCGPVRRSRPGRTRPCRHRSCRSGRP